MKELLELESWANKIVLGEKKPVQSQRMGTPMKGTADRPLPRQIDIQYKAQRAHPELSPEQALALYMSDELVDKEKMDFAQNKLINAQKRQNEKLTRSLDELSKELHSHEVDAQNTDKEVARLKDLSSKLKPAGELQQQAIKASSDKVEQMLSQLDSIKTKPGMDPAKVKEIEDRIEQIKNSPADNKDIDKVNATLNVLAKRQEVDDQLFNTVMNRLVRTENELQAKEKRFQKSITKNAQKIGSWGNKFTELDKKFSEIEKRADDKLKEIETIAQDADETVDQLARMIRMANPNQVIEPTTQALNTIDDREEVQQQMGTPSSTTLPAHYTEPESDDTDLALDEPEDEESFSKMTDLLNKYRKPTNVKRGGQMNEEITMGEPEDEVETVIIPRLVIRYNKMFPSDLKIYSEEQLKTIFRKTVDRRLLIWAPDIDAERVKNYLIACHNWLRKLRPVNPELPGINSNTPTDVSNKPTGVPNKPAYEWPPRPENFGESLLYQFSKDISKLTNGY